MEYFDIKLSFKFESKLNIYFLNQLIIMGSSCESSCELLSWIIYRTSSTYFKFVCCGKNDTFDISIFEKYLTVFFNEFFTDSRISINSIDNNNVLNKILESSPTPLNENHSRKVVS